jgi:hypothetical protein
VDGSEKKALPSRDQILREIEEDKVLIERSERRCAEAPEVIRKSEESERRLIQIIRQLART